jgi:hypothetical protein
MNASIPQKDRCEPCFTPDEARTAWPSDRYVTSAHLPRLRWHGLKPLTARSHSLASSEIDYRPGSAPGCGLRRQPALEQVKEDIAAVEAGLARLNEPK